MNQLRTQVEVSSHSEANKNHFLQHFEDFTSRYECFISENTDLFNNVSGVSNVIDHHLPALIHVLERLETIYQQEGEYRHNHGGFPTPLIQWLDKLYLLYIPYGSRHPPMSPLSNPAHSCLVSKIRYLATQLKRCSQRESGVFLNLAVRLEDIPQYEWRDFPLHFWDKIDHPDLDQGGWIWERNKPQTIPGNGQQPLLDSILEVQEDSNAYLEDRQAVFDQALSVSSDLGFLRLSSRKWWVPDGIRFPVWLEARRLDLRKEVSALRRDIKLRAEVKEKFWE